MNVKFIDFFIDELNYGCKLIQYSMSRYLTKRYGCHVEIYDTREIKNWNVGNFNDFDERYLTVRRIKSLDDIVFDEKTTDLFMFPGDQIWNFASRKDQQFFYEFFTLPFIPRGKKVAYSVSDNNFFKNNSNNGVMKPQHKWFLENIEHVSVREMDTCDFLNKNGVNAVVNIDGVFLTTVDEWKEFATCPDDMDTNDDFDLYYFVHNTSTMKVDETRNHVIVKGNIKGSKRVWSIQEFLWLCSHCKNLYTNSFHGFCFGLMFNRKIYCTSWKDFRISQLMRLLNARITNGVVENHDEVMKHVVDMRVKANNFLDLVFQTRIVNIGNSVACFVKNKFIRELSTSGGVCGLLANEVISKGGVVYGAAYIDGFRHVKTIKVETISDYFKLLAKSKYSFCQDCDFKWVKSYLESGKKVLFIGCPCQIRRLKEFLNKDYENLLLVDLFCYGYSEPKVLENFIVEVEKSGSQVVSLDMRKNHKYICSVKFMDGSGKEYNNVFSKFINKENLMPMCKECNMHKGSNMSDITVGDFWGFKQGNMPDVFSPKKGTNIVVLNTQQGTEMFNSISSELEVLKV